MSEVTSLRRAKGSGLPERREFQVILTLTASEPLSPEELEDTYVRARDTLTEEARGIVFGAVGGVDFTTNTVEMEFTVAAISPAVFYAKLGEVMRVLELAGFEYEGSREERLALEPA